MPPDTPTTTEALDDLVRCLDGDEKWWATVAKPYTDAGESPHEVRKRFIECARTALADDRLNDICMDLMSVLRLAMRDGKVDHAAAEKAFHAYDQAVLTKPEDQDA